MSDFASWEGHILAMLSQNYSELDDAGKIESILREARSIGGNLDQLEEIATEVRECIDDQAVQEDTADRIFILGYQVCQQMYNALIAGKEILRLQRKYPSNTDLGKKCQDTRTLLTAVNRRIEDTLTIVGLDPKKNKNWRKQFM